MYEETRIDCFPLREARSHQDRVRSVHDPIKEWKSK